MCFSLPGKGRSGQSVHWRHNLNCRVLLLFCFLRRDLTWMELLNSQKSTCIWLPRAGIKSSPPCKGPKHSFSFWASLRERAQQVACCGPTSPGPPALTHFSFIPVSPVTWFSWTPTPNTKPSNRGAPRELWRGTRGTRNTMTGCCPQSTYLSAYLRVDKVSS